MREPLWAGDEGRLATREGAPPEQKYSELMIGGNLPLAKKVAANRIESSARKTHAKAPGLRPARDGPLRTRRRPTRPTEAIRSSASSGSPEPSAPDCRWPSASRRRERFWGGGP